MKRVEEFATARCGESQDLYQKRGGFKRDDIVSGAMGEIAVYKFLKDKGFKVNKPDFTIHTKGRKSYGADLMDSKRHFHVKSQSTSSSDKYGFSWLLQRTDKIVVQGARYHYVVPTNVDINRRSVIIFGIIPTLTLHEWSCFSECVVPYFRHSKVALYLESLRQLSYKSRWGILGRVR